MKIWINAGELSGDIQASEVLKELKIIMPDLDVVGMGGENLEKAGMKLLFHIKELSVMGLMEVILVLPKIIKLLIRIYKKLKEEKPDLIILTDAPDFNFMVARFAKKLNIPVYYFIPPKVWAWRTYRVKFLKKYVRKIYSILPFELDFYKKHGVNVDYVGNPLVKLVNFPEISDIEPVENKIGLMPGSRKREIEYLLPEFCLCAEKLSEKNPNLEFHLIKAPNISIELINKYWNSKLDLKIVEPENRYAFMRTCKCLIMASGTASLESGLAKIPSVVCYKVNALTSFFGHILIKVKWASLTNLIMNREVFPECIQENFQVEKIVYHVNNWLENPIEYQKIVKDCEILQDKCGNFESAKSVAQNIKEELENLY